MAIPRLEWLLTALKSIGDAVIATDADRNVLFINPAACRLTGWTEEEALGRGLPEILPLIDGRTDQPIPRPAIEAMRLATPVEVPEHTMLIAKDGRRVPMEDIAAPIIDDQGRAIGCIVSFRDITERKRAEDARREADRRKDEFLAMLAHELRNPLAAIRNAIQLLQLADVPAEHAEWAKAIIDRQVRHLARLIDDLLDVSRITQGKVELRKERIDASPVINSAVDAVRPLIEEKKQQLSVSFMPGTLWCEVDPTRLEQILINLLTNATRYTEAGGQLWLSARPEEEKIVFVVQDTGVGIPPDQLSQMFELFAQGDRSSARTEGGLGIGLTIVKRIAELHGGSATASSEGPGKGSRFTVTLPAIPRPTPSAARQPDGGAAGPTPSRILIVDDNADTALGLARLLKLLGHAVRVAHDGPAAIAAVREERPDFLLLDIGLPGMDGYEVASRLRREPDMDRLVMIAITGYGQDEDRRRSLAAGFDHHLVKPVEYHSLVTLLASSPGR